MNPYSRLILLIFLLFGQLSIVYAYPIDGLESADFAMNFDHSKGDLIYNANTNEAHIETTTVTEIFRNGIQQFNDSFIGLTVEGSGHFLGNPSDFDNLIFTDFTLSFKNGTETVLTFNQTISHFPEFITGTNNTEALDVLTEMDVVFSGDLDSIFFNDFSDFASNMPIWFGGKSYTKDIFTGRYSVTDAVAVISTPVPEPSNLSLIISGLAVLGFMRNRYGRKLIKPTSAIYG